MNFYFVTWRVKAVLKWDLENQKSKSLNKLVVGMNENRQTLNNKLDAWQRFGHMT